MRCALSAALLAALLVATPVRADWQRNCVTDSNDQLSCWVSLWTIQPDASEYWLRVLVYANRFRVMLITSGEAPFTTPVVLRVDRNAPWTSEAPSGSHAMFTVPESDAIAYELRQGKAVVVRTQIGTEPVVLRFNLAGSAAALEGARRAVLDHAKPR